MNPFRRRWLIFWALLCTALVVFCSAVWRPVRVHLQALAVVRQVAGQPVPRVALALTEPVMREDLTLRIEDQEMVRAREYLPVHQPNAPAMVIFHGVHHLGIDEPRLVAFAAAMASCGIRVLTPELPDIKDYRVSQASVQTIGGSVKWFAEHTGGPVGVMGLSFSGGLALVAAADPLYHRDFKFVMAVGSQDSMARVTDYYRTGSDLRPDGTLERLPAHEYGPLVLEYEYLDDFIPARDLAPVRAVLRAHLYEDSREEVQASLALNEIQKREALELMDATSATTHARIAATAQKHAREMAGLSPGGRLEGLRTPVYLLHGEGDNIIPAAETLWMASELPRTELKAVLVSPVISHLDLDGAGPRAMDYWHLLHFFAEVMQASESR
jgi:pimeloyl-ACP methyl ester carboxylesterase